MQALILAGGEGTRLRPLTSTVPKPVIPLVGRPSISYMTEWLGRHGVGEVVIACGFMADDLREVLGEGGSEGPRLRYVEEPEPLGTGGAIKFAEGLLEDRFLALNGDLLTDLDLTALISEHERHNGTATLALHPVPDPSGYGLVRRTEAGEILEFLEKPSADQAGTDEISAGAYVLERSVLDLIPAGREVSIEREVFPRLVGSGLRGLRLEGYWIDIGTPERYLRASWDILEGSVETAVGRRLGAGRISIEPGATIAAAAEVSPPTLVQGGARIGPGARIGGRAVIGPGCQIGDGAIVEGAVLHEDCRIDPGAMINDAILAAGVEIGEGTRIGRGTVIGERARIGSRNHLPEGARVPPGARVADGEIGVAARSGK